MGAEPGQGLKRNLGRQVQSRRSGMAPRPRRGAAFRKLERTPALQKLPPGFAWGERVWSRLRPGVRRSSAASVRGALRPRPQQGSGSSFPSSRLGTPLLPRLQPRHSRRKEARASAVGACPSCGAWARGRKARRSPHLPDRAAPLPGAEFPARVPGVSLRSTPGCRGFGTLRVRRRRFAFRSGPIVPEFKLEEGLLEESTP